MKDKKTLRSIGFVALHLVLVAALVWGGVMIRQNALKENSAFKTGTENNSRAALASLIGEAGEINSLLEECLMSNEQRFLITNLSQLGKSAASAAALLTSLPISHVQAGETIAYLNQLEDFSQSILGELAGGKALSEENKLALKSFLSSSETFKTELDYLYLKSNDKDFNFSFSDVENIFLNTDSNYASGLFDSMSASFENYPQINYDGAYSDHMSQISYKGLEGAEEMKNEDVQKNIDAYLASSESKYTATYDSDVKSGIAGYSYKLSDGENSLSAVFSSRGGKLISISSSPSFSEATLTVEQAQEKADSFIKSLGLSDVAKAYHTVGENSVTFEYIASQEEMLCPCDCIKVMVSLSDGAIIGYDAGDYYTFHTQRSFEKAKLSPEEAKALLPQGFNATEVKSAAYQSCGNTESLCYEICGEYNGKNYAIYVDGASGAIKDIKRCVNDERGMYYY